MTVAKYRATGISTAPAWFFSDNRWSKSGQRLCCPPRGESIGKGMSGLAIPSAGNCIGCGLEPGHVVAVKASSGKEAGAIYAVIESVGKSGVTPVCEGKEFKLEHMQEMFLRM